MTLKTASRFWLLVISLFLMAHPGGALAASVKKVKGEGVLLQLDQDGGANIGDSFYALDSNNKKKAIIEITKVKGAMAVGKIRKGKAEVGMSVAPRKGGGGASGGEDRRAERIKTLKEKKKSSGGGPFAVGAMLGLSYDSMNLTAAPPAGSTIAYNINGTGYSAHLAGDYMLTRNIGIRALAGLETFSATGSISPQAPCGGFRTGNCSTSINFLIADGQAEYKFKMGPGDIVLGAGAGVWLPMSSSTNALDSSTITTMIVMHIAGGYDYKLSDSVYIPVQISYHFFPSSASVQTTLIAVRAGVMFNF